MDQQVCLRWNNFHSSLTSTLEYLWDEESLVDVTLFCEGQEIKAHKIILSACSPTFKSLLKDTSCQHPIIILHNILFTDLEAILQFIYKGEVNIDQDQLSSLLRAATTLQIRGLAGISDREKNISLQPEEPDESSPGSPKKPRLQPPTLRKAARAIPKETSSANSAEKPKNEKTKRTIAKITSGSASSVAANNEEEPQQLLEPKEEPLDLEDRVEEEIVGFEENLEELAENLVPVEDSGEVPEINPIIAINRITNPEQSGFSQVFSGSDYRSSQCPPYPCPLCFRSYTSWGFRRRHIKSMHTFGTSIPCKWCTAVMPSNDEWEKHVMGEHSLTKAEAEQGLLVVEEAHMVLQNTNPPRLDTLVDMVHQGNVTLGE